MFELLTIGLVNLPYWWINCNYVCFFWGEVAMKYMHWCKYIYIHIYIYICIVQVIVYIIYNLYIPHINSTKLIFVKFMRVSEVIFNNNSPRPRLLIVNSIWSWIMVPQVPSNWKGAPGEDDSARCFVKSKTENFCQLSKASKGTPLGCVWMLSFSKDQQIRLEGRDDVMVFVVIFERKQTMIWGMVVRKLIKLQVCCFGLVFVYCAKIHAKFDGFQVVIEDTLF